MRRLLAQLIFLIACAELSCLALMIRIDGRADIRPVVVAPDTVILALTVSGTQVSELIALELATGKLRWRQKAGVETSAGASDGKGAFYIVNTNSFQKRDLSTGSILWQTNLLSMPRQGVVWKTLRERLADAKAFFLRQRPGPPTYFHCANPVFSKDGVFLARDAFSGGGCVSIFHFSDWLVFNSTKGTLINSGYGAFAGCVDSTAFCADSRQFVIGIRDGKTIGTLHWAVSNIVSTTYEQDHSIAGRALILGEQNGGEAASLVNSAGHELAWFPGLGSNWLTGWVLMANGVLRYSMRNMSELAKRPFVELSNFTGHTVASCEIAIPDAGDWYLSCLGVTSTGVPVLYSKPHVFSLALPSLQPSPLSVQRFSGNVTDDRKVDDDFHVDVNSPLVFHVSGNAMLYKMHQPSEEHELTVHALDPTANRIVWTHREQVVIKKVN